MRIPVRTGVLALFVVTRLSSAARAGSLDSGPISPALPVFLLATATAIAGLWIVDLLRGDKIDSSKGFWALRDLETGQRLLPHLLAETMTSVGLAAAAIGCLSSRTWARELALIALGALVYTSLNSLSWVMGDRERWAYGVPMLAALVGAMICSVYLLQA